MNYAAHYERLIARARDRVLEGYRERHHIVPRCIGGGNEPENIVELAPEEHYVAHQLLVKIHPGVVVLAHAAAMMAQRCARNKAYGWLRRRSVIYCQQAARMKRRPLSFEHRAKLSAAMKGRQMPPRSQETRTKLAAAARGNTNNRGKKLPPFSPEHRAKIAAAKRGNNHCAGREASAETRAKIGAASRARNHSLEARAKMSVSQRAAWERRKAAT